MKLERLYIRTVKNIKKRINHGYAKDASEFYPIVRNNRPYGDEYLLRRYASEKQDLYAIIEHGLYFGKNTAMVGLKHEWELGCILTSGNYRKDIINKYYPDYYCETIGPMIAYARFDTEFKNKIESQIDPCGKTLLFFPAHSTQAITMQYDTNLLLQKINSIAEVKGCDNIIICVGYFDIKYYKSIMLNTYFPHKNICVTSNGERYDSHFLDHQRTLIEISDYTVSNQLGTHIGYCVYLKKPHILINDDLKKEASPDVLKEEYGTNNRSTNWKSDQEKEEELFAGIFSLENSDNVTASQYDLCNYYWGFDQVKSRAEIRNIYKVCYDYSKIFRQKHKI